jgi:hypothetical protein
MDAFCCTTQVYSETSWIEDFNDIGFGVFQQVLILQNYGISEPPVLSVTILVH